MRNFLRELCAYRARTDLIIVWDLVRWLALCARNNIIIRLVDSGVASTAASLLNRPRAIDAFAGDVLDTYIYLLERQREFNH